MGSATVAGDAVFDETPGQRAALDQELEIEGAGEDPVQGPDDQLVLTDGQRTHNGRLYGTARQTQRPAGDCPAGLET